MGNVIYLPQRQVSAAFDHKKNNPLERILLGVGGVLFIYGLYRLVKVFDGR